MQNSLIYTAIFSALALTGCASSTESGSKLINFPGAYKIDIQQGNAVTKEMVDKLQNGMTRIQVQYIMGVPMLEDTFNKNLWHYVYSMQPGGEKRTQKTLTLIFRNNQLKSILSDLKPDSPS
ncbi:MAG: outer membrane protein assembly factor BamE [Candidatus Endonucleobacter sp. (ex Gigantidas childressi)]|nr:outer membrane protein assembly factor BamE [Candidatus Endonucleobacter sp. (ex Gigantidas childressi)]